jgi:hypothetical protein
MDQEKQESSESVTDEELIGIIAEGLRQSSTGYSGSDATLATERAKATYEYGMLPVGHLSPQGVSRIVSSDTVEVVEGYLAILSELLLNNNKLVRFSPFEPTPTAVAAARTAAELTNYIIFKLNPGWSIINTWIKAALLWKLGIVRWEVREDTSYQYEEFDEIPQGQLDLLLADTETEVVGSLNYTVEPVDNPEVEGEVELTNIYKEVRIRKKVTKRSIVIRNVERGTFLVTTGVSNLDESPFVGIPTRMSKSELLRWYPDEAGKLDLDELSGSTILSEAMTSALDEDARKLLAGSSAATSIIDRGRVTDSRLLNDRKEFDVLECWVYADRDGDGIAERRRIITVNDELMLEQDSETVDVALLSPFEIPFELEGLSAADMARPSTLGTTAILRGFIENVYLTNYAPKLADPNTVDFSSLQNLKPKQLIPVTGNPNNVVASLTPDAISVGTVPLLELLQTHKEQATGLSKAAQGLNDLLFVSGNSEEKLSKAISAAQVRIQYMARRFVETGFKKLAEGVYKALKSKMGGQTQEYLSSKGYFRSVDPATLPECLSLEIDADVGENGNTNVVKKMEIVGKSILPALREAGAGGIIAPAAAANIAARTLEALDLDPLDYIVDYTAPDFAEKAEAARKAEEEAENRRRQLEDKIKQLDIKQREATIALTDIQGKNAIQDNARQMMVAFSKYLQDWAEIEIKAAKEGVELTTKPPKAEELMMRAFELIRTDLAMPTKVSATEQETPAGDPPA